MMKKEKRGRDAVLFTLMLLDWARLPGFAGIMVTCDPVAQQSH